MTGRKDVGVLQNSVQSECLGVRCSCMLLKDMGICIYPYIYMIYDIYIYIYGYMQAFWTCITVPRQTKSFSF